MERRSERRGPSAETPGSRRDERTPSADGRGVTSAAIAAFLDARHRGPVVPLTGVDSLQGAGESDLAFSVHESSAPVEDTSAGAVICRPASGDVAGQTQIVVSDPRLGFARAARTFFGDDRRDGPPEIHASASVHDDVEVGDGTHIGPYAHVLAPASIGERCTIRAGTVIGGPGFGYARDEAGTPHRLVHDGGVRIGSDVDIGPNCTIDRAVFDETIVHDDVKLSAGVHVAHNVTIGSKVLVAFGVGFGGGASIDERVTIHPEAAIAEGVAVGAGAEIGMNSTVLEDVAPGETVVGSPARPVGRGTTATERRESG